MLVFYYLCLEIFTQELVPLSYDYQFFCICVQASLHRHLRTELETCACIYFYR